MGLLTLCSERGVHSKGCLDWNSVRSGVLSGRCVVNDLPKGADAEICRADAVDAGETRRRTVGNNSDKDMVEESRVKVAVRHEWPQAGEEGVESPLEGFHFLFSLKGPLQDLAFWLGQVCKQVLSRCRGCPSMPELAEGHAITL